MPSLENRVPANGRNTLARKASASAIVFTRERAGFYRHVLPKIARAIRATDERLQMLHAGVDVIAGKGEQQTIVRIVPDDAIARLNTSLIALVECERSLLGFPNPGRRRDESDMKSARASENALIEAEEGGLGAKQADGQMGEPPI